MYVYNFVVWYYGHLGIPRKSTKNDVDLGPISPSLINIDKHAAIKRNMSQLACMIP